jgi:secreted trypsin-like serine protease
VQIRHVAHFQNHDGYRWNSIHYDIAVLYLETAMHATKYVRPICLQSPTDNEKLDTAIVLGWGKVENQEHGNELKKAALQILDLNTCESRVRNATWRNGAVHPTGGNSGTCTGDSGGPIFSLDSRQWRYVLKGIVNGGERCGHFGYPDFYTSTTFVKIYDWLVEKVSCANGYQCTSREACPRIRTKYEVYENANKDSDLKAKTRNELQSLICDIDKRTFWCCIEQTGW